MGFFDQIGKKATEMYQGAKDKTSQISGELKLKSKISEEKDKITNFYSELGKMVFEEYTKNGDAFSNEVANKCREIIASKEAIENLNKEIMALKDTIACLKCGEVWYASAIDVLKNIHNATRGTTYNTNQVRDLSKCPKCGSGASKHKTVKYWVDKKGNCVDRED